MGARVDLLANYSDFICVDFDMKFYFHKNIEETIYKILSKNGIRDKNQDTLH